MGGMGFGGMDAVIEQENRNFAYSKLRENLAQLNTMVSKSIDKEFIKSRHWYILMDLCSLQKVMIERKRNITQLELATCEDAYNKLLVDAKLIEKYIHSEDINKSCMCTYCINANTQIELPNDAIKKICDLIENQPKPNERLIQAVKAMKGHI